MTITALRTQFDYGYWANAKVLSVVSILTTEQFTQPVSGSYGSIRNTLVHMMSTEWGWLDRAGGPKRGPKLSGTDFPTFASVVEKWTEIEMNVRRFLDGLKDEDLARLVCAFGRVGVLYVEAKLGEGLAGLAGLGLGMASVICTG